jgi:hypothetical protein
MREYIIRDWKAQEPASGEDSDDESGADDWGEAREVPAEVAPFSPPPAAPEAREVSDSQPAAAPEDPTLGGAIRFKRFPAAATRPREERPAPREAKAGSPPRKRGERQFIIAYDGVFVGFFEATEEVTPREAYVRVAQDLAEDESFDSEKLSLYKPVLLRSARPARGVNVIRGKMARLSWQPKKATIVPEPQGEERSPVAEVEGS